MRTYLLAALTLGCGAPARPAPPTSNELPPSHDDLCERLEEVRAAASTNLEGLRGKPTGTAEWDARTKPSGAVSAKVDYTTRSGWHWTATWQVTKPASAQLLTLRARIDKCSFAGKLIADEPHLVEPTTSAIIWTGPDQPMMEALGGEDGELVLVVQPAMWVIESNTDVPVY